jgi:hypothetical protein
MLFAAHLGRGKLKVEMVVVPATGIEFRAARRTAMLACHVVADR